MFEEEITSMSKETFKQKVRKNVNSYAFEKLKKECQSKSKTGGINYGEFGTQEYISKNIEKPECLMFGSNC